MSNDPLVKINWSRLLNLFKAILGLFRKLIETIIKTILKILTMLLLGFLATYKKLSKFAKRKHYGIWILLLLFSIILIVLFFLNREKKQRILLENSESTDQKYERLLEDFEKLYKQGEELDKKLQVYNSKKKPLATTVVVRKSQDVEDWRWLIEKYFPPQQVENALAVMACESGGNIGSINYNDAKITGYPSYGLYQINGPDNWSWDDPEKNVDRAVTMFYTRGWQPWSNCARKLGLL